MSLFKIQMILTMLILLPALSWASPFLVCDPTPSAVGGKYEVWEVTTAKPEGAIVFTGTTEPDGSMKADLNSVTKGTHNYKVRFVVGGVQSPFAACTLISTILESKSVTKSFTSYSITKGWTLKVPPSTSGIVPKAVN